MLVFASLIPISHLVFIKSQKVKTYVGYFSSLLAFSLLVLALVEKKEYLLAVPCAVLLLIYTAIKSREKTFDPIEFIGVVFSLAAMITIKNVEVVALGLGVDLLFVLSQKNHKKYFLVLVPWLPLLLGYVFASKTEFFDFFLAATIVLRVFDWPVRISPKENSPEIQEFVTKIVISVALWKTTEMLSPGFWIAFWMILPLFFSWGGGEKNVLLLTTLSLWSISPNLGLYSLALWPLYFLSGRWGFALAALVGVAGFISNGNISGLNDEWLMVLAALQALAISTAEVRFVTEKQNHKNWFVAVMLFIAAATIGGVYLTTPQFEIKILNQSNVFIGLNIAFVFGGLLLAAKKKQFFQRLPEINVVENLLNKIESSGYFNLKRSSKTEFYEFSFMKKVFNYMDTDAYLVMLIAVVAAIMFWGVL